MTRKLSILTAAVLGWQPLVSSVTAANMIGSSTITATAGANHFA